MLSSLRNFSKDEVAQQRHRIMEFYDKYGEQATREAFGADRKVISRWRKKLRQNGGALEVLVPESTRPKRGRTMTVAAEIHPVHPADKAGASPLRKRENQASSGCLTLPGQGHKKP